MFNFKLLVNEKHAEIVQVVCQPITDNLIVKP